MSDETVHILLIEDNPGDARLLEETLAHGQEGAQRPGRPGFTIECVRRLADGLERLAAGPFDVILLDLGLPDSEGLETFLRVHVHSPEVPIVLLTALADEELAIQTLQQGAQDYLVKGNIDGALLIRALRYAIERHRLQAALRSLSLVDELTGLYNRRGFLTLAEAQLKLALRKGRGLLLLYADLDGLKKINDIYGHPEGDRALIQVAQVLKERFRPADIAARVGGDEFAVLASETTAANGDVLNQRLREHLAVLNRQNERYDLSLSLGTAWWDSANPCSIEDLLAAADAAMYRHKRAKR